MYIIMNARNDIFWKFGYQKEDAKLCKKRCIENQLVEERGGHKKNTFLDKYLLLLDLVLPSERVGERMWSFLEHRRNALFIREF